MREQDRFDALSPRHRECLRRVYELRVSKEIAAELGLTKATVDSYISRAIRILDARDRRDAARLFVAWEQSQSSGDAVAPEAATCAPPLSSPADRVGGVGRHAALRLSWLAGAAIVGAFVTGLLTDGPGLVSAILPIRGLLSH